MQRNIPITFGNRNIKLLFIFPQAGVTVKMHSPKIVLPSNYLPGNKNSPVSFPRKLLLLGVYIY